MDWRSDMLDGLTAEIAAVLEDAAPLAARGFPDAHRAARLRQTSRDIEALAAAIEVIERRAAGAASAPGGS